MSDRRIKVLHITLEIAAIASSFDGWFSASDVHEIYRDEVGTIHPRTVIRYLHQLAEAGLLDTRRKRIVVDGRKGCVVRLQFGWVGWPGVMEARETRLKPSPFTKRKPRSQSK